MRDSEQMEAANRAIPDGTGDAALRGADRTEPIDMFAHRDTPCRIGAVDLSVRSNFEIVMAASGSSVRSRVMPSDLVLETFGCSRQELQKM